MIFRSEFVAEGRLRGRGNGRGEGSRFARILTNRVMFGPEGWPANGSFAASFITSRAEQIMISHLNGSFLAIAARSVDSLTFSRTTKVPTAPIFTIPNFESCFAINAG